MDKNNQILFKGKIYSKFMKWTLLMLSIFVLTSCSGNSNNIYIIADTSTPDESVEEEFCRRTGRDNYPITNYEKK